MAVFSGVAVLGPVLRALLGRVRGAVTTAGLVTLIGAWLGLSVFWLVWLAMLAFVWTLLGGASGTQAMRAVGQVGAL